MFKRPTVRSLKPSIRIMSKIRHILLCLPLVFSLGARAANTNSLVWRTGTDRVSADVHGELLWPLLEDLAHQTGWHIFVEPDTERSASVKFNNLPSGEALKMLLGDLNFALVPKTNAPAQLYVFRTTMQNATRQVLARKAARRIANELLIRVKPGTDIDALAKMFGAKITGRIDKLGIYRLQFADAAAADAALAQLKNDSDVLDVDYNYYLDPPPPASDCSKVIIGLPDTAVQPLGDLDKFISKRISVADGSPNTSTLLHGTGMAQTILAAVAKAQSGGSSVQIVA